jgi:LuxR family maltose regulon positive regulatory protein
VIQRERLTACLEQAIGRPVTLVAAPAGAGKTTLIADWARRHPGAARVAWLTLSPEESTIHGFWNALSAALGKRAMRGPQPDSPEEVAERVRAILAPARRPLALVLDDFQEADSEELSATLHALVAEPSLLRVVIATRVDPGLALQRLRVADQLSEIRGHDLAFTMAEAAQLFERERLPLASEQVESLVDRTEGWAAGLRLAALMLADEADPATAVSEFAGDDRAVVSYLIAEVLDRQPAPMRELLLRTAVVDRVCGTLADALTGGIMGQVRLEELVRRNAFVVPLDRHGRWFRYHALFAELLRSQLASRGGAAWREQHRRAAEWFAAQGLAREALDHGVKALDWGVLRTVLIEHWRQLRSEDSVESIDAALDVIPTDVLEQLPHVQLIAAVRCFDRDDAARGDALLFRAVAQGSRLGSRRRSLFLRDLALVRLERARSLGDVQAGMSQAAAASASLEGNLERDLCARALAHLELGRLRMAAGDDAAEADLHAASELARAGAATTMAALADGERALLHALAGRVGRSALVLGAIAERPHGAGRVPAAELARALVAVELGNTVAASESLARAAEQHVGPPCRLRALQASLIRARIAARSDAETVQAALEALDTATAGWRLPDRLATLAAAARVRLLAGLGQPDASEEITAVEVLPELDVALALSLLSDGEGGAAHRRAIAVADAADSDTPALHVVGALAVAAAASEAEGDNAGAARLAERALERAEPEGLRRALADAAPMIEPAFAHLLRYGTAHRSLIGEVLDLVHSGATAHGEAPVPPREELSARELAVLRYLPTMLTSQEIAGELFVSLNTVKSHLKNVYRKLDADGRRDAVRRARELGLVAPGGISSPRQVPAGD